MKTILTLSIGALAFTSICIAGADMASSQQLQSKFNQYDTVPTGDSTMQMLNKSRKNMMNSTGIVTDSTTMKKPVDSLQATSY